MTKVIILGQEPEKKKGKPIEFVTFLDNTLEMENAESKPIRWDNIEVISFDYIGNFDLFFAYLEGDRKNGVLYLGHYNDGIVE